MKHILLSIFLTLSINSYSQTINPELFQTWYLYSVSASDGARTYLVDGIESNISPTLTIMEDLSFTAIGACNEYNGNFNLIDIDFIRIGELSNTIIKCDIEDHYNLDLEYYFFLNSAYGFWISEIDGGLELRMATPIFGLAIFKNFTLSLKDMTSNQFKIYPNPTNSFINIEYTSKPTKIELYNSLGQKVKVINSNFNTVDISNLDKDIYMMIIETNLGTTNKKILKY